MGEAEEIARRAGGAEIPVRVKHCLDEVIARGQRRKAGEGIAKRFFIHDDPRMRHEILQVARERLRRIRIGFAQRAAGFGIVGLAQNNEEPTGLVNRCQAFSDPDFESKRGRPGRGGASQRKEATD